ncbi:response regulator, partial [Paenibacillus graminis]
TLPIVSGGEWEENEAEDHEPREDLNAPDSGVNIDAYAGRNHLQQVGSSGLLPAGGLPPGLPEAKYGPLRILVAEDHPVNQKLILTMLEKRGYRADLAENGQQALQAILRQPYDLVFMD